VCFRVSPGNDVENGHLLEEHPGAQALAQGAAQRVEQVLGMIHAERTVVFSSDYPHFGFDDPRRMVQQIPQCLRRPVSLRTPVGCSRGWRKNLRGSEALSSPWRPRVSRRDGRGHHAAVRSSDSDTGSERLRAEVSLASLVVRHGHGEVPARPGLETAAAIRHYAVGRRDSG
jgi:hypothetical protein